MPAKYTATKPLKEVQRKQNRAHPILRADATNEEIDAYIDANVTSIPDVREMLKVLAKRGR